MNIRKATAFGAIAALTVGVLALGGTAAQADVTNPGTTYQTVGSDTTQDVLAGLATLVHTGNAASPLALSTFDATPQPTTFTSQTGTTVPRSDGSSQGLAALKAAETGAIYTRTIPTPTGNVTQSSSAALTTNDVKFSRSSSGPSSPSATGTYAWVPFAVDGVTFAKNSSNTITNLTKADLKAIYEAANGATVTLSIGSKIIGTQSNATADIVPFLPQSGSGTRTFWLTTIGVTTLGSAVSDTYTVGGAATQIQEHNGAVLAAVPKGIVPFSISQWLGQSRNTDINKSVATGGYGLSIVDRRNGAVLANIDSTSPTTTNAAGKLLLNTGFSVLRPVFNVVKYDRVTSGTASYDSVLAGVLTGTSAKVGTAPALVLAGATVVEDFGFAKLSTNPASPTVINGTGYVLGQTTIRSN
ncbi:substrate-binding domain-containing protein [uncultured Microbacterium sp.]|uniref:substrate-binding domain-containing protein n=1 Tax=uncultured Microbacterium sp. TaxID=191216 RepID=UPI0035CB39A7